MNEIIIFPLLFSVVGMLYFTAVFARDAESGVNRTILAGPVSRNALVYLNYLVTIVIGVVAFLVDALVGKFMGAMMWEDVLAFALLSFAGAVLLVIIQLPLFYRFGPEKAKLFLVAVFVLIFASSSFIGDYKEQIAQWFADIHAFSSVAISGIVLGVVLVFTGVSLVVSRKIVASREF
ncbi:MAG: ABC-2 transporter permease [Actinomycetaceae bacterium]|nr:ABC-2 transporter permease [Actinomycetaceae bacterium]